MPDLTADDDTDERRGPHAVPLDLPELATVVVAPTVDDAVRLAGGLIALQRARGVEVTVLQASEPPTDDTAPHDDTALSILGLDAVTGLASTPLDDVGAIADRITAIGHCDLIVAPFVADPADVDHGSDAVVARAAERAAAQRGAALLFGIRHSAEPTLPADLVGERLLRLALDETSRDRWRRALALTALRDPDAVGDPAEFFLAPSSPIAPGDATRGAPGLETGVPPVSSGGSGTAT